MKKAGGFMELNIHIIYDSLKKYKPKLYTYKEKGLTLSRVCLPKFDETLNKHYIYVMNAEEIKKYHSILHDIDIISIGTLSKEVRHSLSVIEISNTYDFITIFNEVQDIFSKYKKWNTNLLKSIASNESLQSIANKAATVLDNPFVLFDITFKLLAIGGEIPKDYEGTSWESVIEKEYVPVETFEIPGHNLYFFLKQNKEFYYPPGNPYSPYTNIFLNLYIDDHLFAILADTDANVPFTNGQLSLLKHIRDMLEFALTSNLKNKGTSEILIYYIEKLLRGLSVDNKILSYHLEKRGWDVNGYFCIYTLSDRNGEKLSDNKEEFCLLRIKKLIKNAIVFTYENYIIVINMEKSNKLDANLIDEMSALLNRLELHAGYSQTFYYFSELQYYYNQSKLAIMEGKITDPEKATWDYNDYYFQYIINVLNNYTSLKMLCHPGILKLLNYDMANNTNFIKCIQTYLVNGCNISQTGKDLFMHRNTLVYRLEKIQQILELDVLKLHELQKIQLWFSCIICKYL